MSGAEGWQLSNPPIVGLAALRASMEIFHEAGMERLRAKSVSLTGYLEFLLERNRFAEVLDHHAARNRAAGSADFASGFRTREGRCVNGWREEGVIGDWREPDIFRVAPVPLYNSYQDVFQFVRRFAAAIGLEPICTSGQACAITSVTLQPLSS